jgi:acyl-CoA thioesterase-2
MVTASLDHAMWFYRDFQIDDWLLYACESPTTGHARGLNHGNIFSRDGKLVACVAQEGLIRRVQSK